MDDDPDDATRTARLLEAASAPFEVETVSDASEGLRRLDEEPVDCVVSEYCIGDGTGITFLETVREGYPDLPFVMYTDAGSEGVASEAIGAGVTDYVRKRPETDGADALASRIEAAVDGRPDRDRREWAVEAIETAQEGIAVLDEDGRFVYVNGAYADLYGYDPGELVGDHWELLYRDEDVSHMREEVLPAVDRTGHWHGKTEGRRADGSTFVEDHVLSRTDEGALVCAVRDATDRVQRQERLEATVAKLEALIENSPNMIVVHDESGRIRDVNQRLADELGYATEDLVGQAVWDLDATVDPATARAFWRDLPVDETRKFEGEYRRRDGSTFPVEIHLVRVSLEGDDRFLAMIHDVTERRERERKLDRLRDRTQALMYAATREETAEVATAAADDVIGAPLSGVHLLAEDGTALEPAAVVEDVEDAFDGAPRYPRRHDPGTRAALVWAVFQRGRPRRIDDARDVPELEEEPPVRSAILYPIGEHGVFIVSAPEAGAFDDVDETLVELLATSLRTALDRVEREAELRSQRDELRRRNERLDQFASIVSHDLRNPLTVAGGRLELAREECESDHLDAVEAAVERMDELIDDLLTLARKGEEGTDVGPVDLGRLAETCWETIATETMTLEVRTDAVVRADEGRVQQLLENLFRNAGDHGDPPVTVRVGELPNGFYVEDDGPGIPADAVDRVFESGFSTVAGGTGLGLSIVSQVVEEHDWSIRVTNGEAGGARFEITDVERVD